VANYSSIPCIVKHGNPHRRYIEQAYTPQHATY